MLAIRNVVCPVDFSPLSERELRMAAQLCRRLGARLYAEHTVASRPPEGLGMAWMYAEEHEREERAAEEAASRRLRKLVEGLPPEVRPQAILTWGPVEKVLYEVAAALRADLIVMGTHGPSRRDRPSITERVIVDSFCPVLATRDDSPEALLPDFSAERPEARIPTLVPVDFSAHSQLALDYAFELARLLPLRLYVVHVATAGEWSPEPMLRALRARVPDDLADRVEVDVRTDRTVEGILRCEEELGVRLMVMGTHHPGLLEKLLGASTARAMLHASPCPVWFVPEHARVA